VVARHPDTQEDKAKGLLQVALAWQHVIDGVADQDQRHQLQVFLDEARAALERGDLKTGLASMKAVGNGWASYGQHRLAADIQRAILPFCEAISADLRQQLLESERSLALLGGRPELSGWEQTLDQIRIGAARVSAEHCLDSLVNLHAQAIALAHAIFTTSLSDARIDARARLAAAERSEVAEAIALTNRLMTGPRAITVVAVTPEQERYAGRVIRFVLGDIDPVWGAGVQIGIDFGDRSAPLLADAERLRQGLAVEHAYAGPITAEVRTTAALQFRPGGIDSAGEVLGSGTAWLFVLPSPISAAQKAADIFFNTQFLIALSVAGVIYFWQFHARDRLFGVRGYDYVEAFALGFVVDAAITDLPARFTKLLGFG
jgi:hypothetical protein